MRRGGIGVLALAVLAGCGGGGVPEAKTSKGEDACLSEVARQAGTSEVALMSSAAGYVTVGVGAGRTPWQCVMNGGRVTQVQALGAGGAL
ncbi:hypothetical protein ACW9UR_09115 [Halovulum sp. GXIMD14794]